MSCSGLREDWSKAKKLEMPERLEPWCRLIQMVLAEEFDEPPTNFREVSEKIVKETLYKFIIKERRGD